MSNWFHRNPLKATAKMTFDMGVVAQSLAARSICSDLAASRTSLLKLLIDPSVTPDSVVATTRQYICLLLGFIEPPEKSEESNGNNKLRYLTLYKWTNSADLKSTPAVMEPDALFEVCSMLFNVALWFTKHAAKLAANESISTEEAKEVYTSLREAAGIFQLIRDQYVPKLDSTPRDGQDLSRDVLEAYINQSVAEAQEVTLGRAMELKHDPALIAGLAKETSTIYHNAALSLKPLELKIVGKWIKYLEFKKLCYETCAYVYFAEHLLKAEKCGAGLAVIAEAEKAYNSAVETAKAYAKAEGVGLSSKMAENCFFRRLGKSVENTKRKLERENSMIFHQRSPPSAPVFDLKATFGLVEPKAPEMDLSPDPRWKDAYKGFNETKMAEMIVETDIRAKEQKGKSDRNAPIEPVREKPIFSTDKDPKNETGCVLS